MTTVQRRPEAVGIDMERFRLRRFVEELVELGMCEVVESPVDLVDVAARLDGNPLATWFRNVAGKELVGNVIGYRERLAHALGTSHQDMSLLVHSRMKELIKPVQVDSSVAPVHEVVRIGAEASFLDLPVHLQHELDGAPYISASIDYATDANGRTNTGCRRIMLRTPTTAGIDLNAPSDLRHIYSERVAKGEILPVAYTVGSHPTDFINAMGAAPECDELELLGGLRQAPVPVVKCKTIDVWVPADAEYVLEGYLDSRGLVEDEGPYGEFVGYYGGMKHNPVFHLTAITSRRDPLFQTATISGRALGLSDTSVLGSIRTESSVWGLLRQTVREPTAVYAPAATGGMYNVRIAVRQRYPGEARNALAAVFATPGSVKNVWVVDPDVDIYDWDQMEWALATRFQGDRDLLVGDGFRAVPIDPSLEGRRTGAKVGYDCTQPFGKGKDLENQVPEVPRFRTAVRRSLEDTLRAGPSTFLQLMEALGSRDGRDVIAALESFYENDQLARTEDGRYYLRATSNEWQSR